MLQSTFYEDIHIQSDLGQQCCTAGGQTTNPSHLILSIYPNPKSLLNDPHNEDVYSEVNRELCRVAPVLASPHARYPLHKKNRWLQPFETTVDGKPAFIPTKEFPHSLIELDTDLPDYVWGYGPLGKGYYHLLTREAYKNLFDYMNIAEFGGLSFFLKVMNTPCYRRKSRELHEIKAIIHNRCCSKTPEDVIPYGKLSRRTGLHLQKVLRFTYCSRVIPDNTFECQRMLNLLL